MLPSLPRALSLSVLLALTVPAAAQQPASPFADKNLEAAVRAVLQETKPLNDEALNKAAT
jgi:hypothetical protein